MIKEDILNWINEHDLLKKCTQNFWIAFSNYKDEEPNEFDEVIGKNEKNVNVKPLRVSYDLLLSDLNNPQYSIILDIYLGEQLIGYYKEIYFPNGELVDDFFVID